MEVDPGIAEATLAYVCEAGEVTKELVVARLYRRGFGPRRDLDHIAKRALHVLRMEGKITRVIDERTRVHVWIPVPPA